VFTNHGSYQSPHLLAHGYRGAYGSPPARPSSESALLPRCRAANPEDRYLCTAT